MIYRFDSLPSTNSAMAANVTSLNHGDIYIANAQTAGRGQRGNSWEAAPGKNLTFSVLLRPKAIAPARAFAVSMLVSIALQRVVAGCLPDTIIKIKWPNDIYAGDYKLCGILIENAFSSVIDRSIVGIGLNVNQQAFTGDAPNPVSMCTLSGHLFDLDKLLDLIHEEIMRDFEDFEANPDFDQLRCRYFSRLWRAGVSHRWLDRRTGDIFTASIIDVDLEGTITFDTEPPVSYTFKEVSPIINNLFLKC